MENQGLRGEVYVDRWLKARTIVMAQSSLYQQVRGVCSSARVDSYKIGRSEIDALAFYVWNIALSEALYPLLQNLEIGLRNRLNDAMSNSYSDDWWFRDTAIVRDLAARQRVIEAERRIEENGKNVTPSRVVSELNFGFWTGLFSTQYEPVIWRRPNLLKAAMPYMSSLIRKRSLLARRFGEIRQLRNRIFHHEPIWHLDLSAEHANIMEALGWLDPCLKKVTASVDRFSAVNSEDYRTALKEKLVRACAVESKRVVAARTRLRQRNP